MPDETSTYHLLRCPCGAALKGDTEDDIVKVAFAHLRDAHPDLADDYGREHILFMAVRLKR